MTTSSTSRYQTEAPLRYQIGDDPLARRRDFYRFVNELARYVIQWAATTREHQVCYDASRPIPRVSVDGWDVLIDLAARADNPLVLGEGLKAAVFQRMASPSPTPCPIEIGEEENEANHALNRAQYLLARDKSHVRMVQTRELAVEQQWQTARLIESLDWRLARKAGAT